MDRVLLKRAALANRKKIFLTFCFTIFLIFAGTFGFMAIESWSFIESFYMSIITLTTVGFGEVRPLSNEGRIFTSVLLVVGLGSFAYGLSTLATFVIDGEFKMFLNDKRLEKEILRLNNHYIVCGFGRNGYQVCQELKRSNSQFLVIEIDEEKYSKAVLEGYTVIHGNAIEDEVLQLAGIERAKGLVATLANDADNVFVTLTARELNEKLHIVTRASYAKTEKKLFRAGANAVVAPNVIGGKRMALTLLRPHVADFLDSMVFGEDNFYLTIEEIEIHKNSPVVGKKIMESNIRQQSGSMIIGIKNCSTKLLNFNPNPDILLETGDILILLGNYVQIEKARKFLLNEA